MIKICPSCSVPILPGTAATLIRPIVWPNTDKGSIDDIVLCRRCSMTLREESRFLSDTDGFRLYIHGLILTELTRLDQYGAIVDIVKQLKPYATEYSNHVVCAILLPHEDPQQIRARLRHVNGEVTPLVYSRLSCALVPEKAEGGGGSADTALRQGEHSSGGR